MTQDALIHADGGSRHELTVSGEVDLSTAPSIQQHGIRALSDPAVSTLTLDLSEVTFIDSTGIGTLVQLRLTADEHHKKVILSRPSERVRRVLTLTGLMATFTVDGEPGVPSV